MSFTLSAFDVVPTSYLLGLNIFSLYPFHLFLLAQANTCFIPQTNHGHIIDYHTTTGPSHFVKIFPPAPTHLIRSVEMPALSVETNDG